MTTGLPVSRLINVSVNLTPAGAQFANLNSAMIIGDSDVIDVGERIRSYASSAAIATDFGNTAPEYLAAVDYFAQTPQPTQVFVGQWAQAARAGRLKGAALTAAQQAALLTTLNAITTGALKLAIDGAAATTISTLNFSSDGNLNAVASRIQTALNAAVAGTTCVFDGSRFVIKSPTTGAASSIAFPIASGTGVDIKSTLKLTAADGARSVNGIVAESALTAVQIIDALPTYAYFMGLATTHAVDADHIAIAAYIEGDTLGPHLYGVTSQAATVPDVTQTTDIASVLKAAGYLRSFGQYSSTDPYAVWSIIGRMVTVNYAGSDTTINVMYQPEPGITAENLTVAQASAMDGKRINYSANYANGVAVLGNGVCFGAAYIDEMTGADWLANYAQTNLFNLLAGAGTKIPQTDEGMHRLANNLEASCQQAVNNGYSAAGIWSAGGFGTLATGDFLPKGFYVYTPPIALQATADRAARKSVLFQVAVKLAGAVDTANVQISINR